MPANRNPNEVHIAAAWQGEFYTTYLIGGVGSEQDVQVARKAKILLIVGQETDVNHFVLLHVERVLQIVAVEGNGVVGNGRAERKLQQAALVVIDVDICKDIL